MIERATTRSIINAAIKDRRISDSAFRTLVLYLLFPRHGGMCGPTRTRLARIRGKDKSAITRHNAELEAAGYIKRERRIGRPSMTRIVGTE